jgi:HPt (histidine-containing phosphotransfer) domain-containing protein
MFRGFCTTPDSLPEQARGQDMNSAVATPSSSVINIDELLSRCMGNAGFAERVLVKFRNRFEVDLAELGLAVELSDAEAIARAAHRIKGAAANVAATRLREGAAVIEHLGRTAQVRDVPQHLTQLTLDWNDFVQATAVLDFGSCSTI